MVTFRFSGGKGKDDGDDRLLLIVPGDRERRNGETG